MLTNDLTKDEEFIAKLRALAREYGQSNSLSKCTNCIQNSKLILQAAELIEELFRVLAEERNSAKESLLTMEEYVDFCEKRYKFFFTLHRMSALEDFVNSLKITSRSRNVYRRKGQLTMSEVSRELERYRKRFEQKHYMEGYKFVQI